MYQPSARIGQFIYIKLTDFCNLSPAGAQWAVQCRAAASDVTARQERSNKFGSCAAQQAAPGSNAGSVLRHKLSVPRSTLDLLQCYIASLASSPNNFLLTMSWRVISCRLGFSEQGGECVSAIRNFDIHTFIFMYSFIYLIYIPKKDKSKRSIYSGAFCHLPPQKTVIKLFIKGFTS